MAVCFPQKERNSMQDLLQIMALLRSEGGCPWDREQTHQSIRKNLIEEAYEACEAIDNCDAAHLKEELGDVLLQVVFHTQMEAEHGVFDFNDVCTGICKKLVERHPHIFADVSVNGADEVLKNWDAIKKREKGQNTDTQALRDVSKALPALMRSQKVQHRAARAGFDYPNTEWAVKSLREELEELEQAIALGDRDHCKEELGDVLFSAVNVSRFLGMDAEESLSESCKKFISRFSHVEQLANGRGIEMKAASMEELDKLWREAKVLETEEK